MATQMTANERLGIHNILESLKKREQEQLTIADPEWKARVEAKKKKVAIGRLKIEKELAEQEEVQRQIDALNKKRAALQEKIDAKLPKKPGRYEESCPLTMSLCEAVAGIAHQVHAAEMQKDVTGKKFVDIDAKYLALESKLAKCTTRADVAAANILPD